MDGSQKGSKRLTDNFSVKELWCPCCQDINIAGEFLKRLQEARDIAGFPFYITSGYRCPKHNSDVGGHPKSPHINGRAVDIFTSSGRMRFLIMESLRKAGFKRIGIGADFVHADDDESRTPEVVWTYYNKK